MGLKQALVALGLSIALSSCIKPTLSPGYKPPAEKVSYDNNNAMLKDEDLNSILPNVRELTIVAHYEVSECSVKGEKVEIYNGSSVRIKGDEGWDYYLTANHVFDLEKSFDALTFEGGSLEICHKELKSSFVYLTDTKKDLEVLVRDKKLDFAYARSPKDKEIKFGDIELGDSSILNVGDFVYAIGYSLGLDRYASSGNISALRMPISIDDYGEGKYDGRFFMFTAPISFGNSGGGVFALYKGKPHLIGIAVVKTEDADNISGANKINIIKEKIREGLRKK